jgi:biopolymer transport protein ExbD
MKLRSGNKINAEFSLASFTDMILLLLMFFIIASTMINPSALKLLLPESSGKEKKTQRISVSVDENGQYFFFKDQVDIKSLKEKLQTSLNDSVFEPVVVLSADRRTTHGNVVEVLNVAQELKMKIILATSPKTIENNL